MSKFFINRPIVAMFISILMVIVGAVTIATLPVAQFPNIVPPEVQVLATYVGADAQTIEQSVATPVEQQMSGVDNMNYMYSLNSTADGLMRLIVDYDVKTDPNTDLMLTQMRQTQAASQLPSDVANYGVKVQKTVTAPLMLVTRYSPNGTYDARFLANYAYINLADQINRSCGIGSVQIFGAGQYAMRLWVKPDRLAKLAINVPEIVSAIQSQNAVNPAGQVGSEPVPKGQQFTYTVRAQGRMTSPEEFGNIVVRESPTGAIVRVKDVARVELGAQSYNMVSRLDGKAAAIVAAYQLPGSNATGCTMGPRYKRPTVAVPGSFRGEAPEQGAQSQSSAPQIVPLAEEKWWDIFQDEQLRTLIRTALKQNYDLRIAASRVLEAQAQLGITRADQFPTLGGGGAIADVRSSQSKLVPEFETSTGQLNVSAAWTLDFWGQFRRATEAARANLLASEWARHEVVSTLVANVASAYFQLRALDLQLEISKRTLDSRRESLRLTQVLANGSATSLLDVRQAEQLVFTASAEVPALEQQIEQQENFLSILLGQNPSDIPRGRRLTEQYQPPEVPPGLPSALLERRPDIRQAEEQMIAANAEIGVARAAYFPQISLSGAGGFQSSALGNLFTGPAGAWSFGASLTQPIFTGGRLRSGVRLAEAREQTALLVYQQSVQGAFRSVSDALVAYRKTREFRLQEELLFESAQDAARLTHMRYSGGVTGYLEVLTNETNAFSAELAVVQARQNELLALVQLYEALGGGWQQ